MTLVRVTEIHNSRRFPQWVNPAFVVRLTPETPAHLSVDGGTEMVQRTRVTFSSGSEYCVQGRMDDVAARMNGDDRE